MELTTELAAIGATGRLGIVRPGVPSTTIVAAYGQPSAEERVHRAHEWPRWLHYSGLRLLFCRCRLLETAVVEIRPEGLQLPDAGHRRVDTPAAPVTEPVMTAALAGAGCPWEVREHWNIGRDRILWTAPVPGAEVGFSFTGPGLRASGRPVEWSLRTLVLSRAVEHDCPEPGGT
ncbi:hypothetical protein ACFVHB_29115 [Kitasatospora sp. NPDC127111]|uniref:hypothetical protein n=1 Tax=Kitasatospora sp. NPDC127111 TaxID=3345363 RepID=UPI003643D6D5